MWTGPPHVSRVFVFLFSRRKSLRVLCWSEPAACSALCCSLNWTCEFHPSFAGTTDYRLQPLTHHGILRGFRGFYGNISLTSKHHTELAGKVWILIFVNFNSSPRPAVIKQKMAIKFAVQGVTQDQLGPGLVGRAPTLDTISHLTIRLNISYLNAKFLLSCKKSECWSDFQRCMIRRQVG